MKFLSYLHKVNSSTNHFIFRKSIISRCVLLLAGFIMFFQSKSQTDKRLLLADQYFAAGEYFTAASLYGQFLHPEVKPGYRSDFPLNVKRNGTGRTGKYKTVKEIVFRQAESYRLANYWTEAAALYKECMTKDSANNAAALYWYAVCQKSLGNYKLAQESLNRFFIQQKPGNIWYNSALLEQQSLQFASKQLVKPDSILYHIQKLNAAWGEKGVFAPAALNENKYLITSTEKDSVPAGTSPYYNRLFSAIYTNDGLQNFSPVKFESFDSSYNQGTATISSDGKHLYFTQWKKIKGQTVSSIYISNKLSDGWSKPRLLTAVNESGHSSKQPFCSPDGNFLFFASDRTGGKGGFDIWYAPLLADGNPGPAVNLAAANTSGNEQAPFYHHATGTLVFASDRMPGMGGYDLYASKRSGNDWGTPENMGYPVNSSRDDIYFFANGNGALLSNAIITSDRGAQCCLATYTVSKMPKKKVITGLIQDCVSNQPLDSAVITWTDAAGQLKQAITASDGKYSFEIDDDLKQHRVAVSKEAYTGKSADIEVQRINESNWQTDTLQNADFCLEKKFILKVENVVTVYFDFDRSELKARGVDQLDSIYSIMTENPSYTLQISAYTDGKGSVAYNKKLSDKRAKSCADYLIRKGLDPSRISFESFGSGFPVEMELINGRDNAEGRSKNRRALININKG